jgi:PEGA domain-containing protein
MAQERSGFSKAVSVVLASAMVSPAFFSTGCAETTRITTIPEGATIYVNGVHIGASPQIYRYRSGLPESYIVELEKPGYKKMSNATIDKSLRADVSLLLLLLVIVPYFFSARFEDQYVFTLEPLPGTVPPEPAAPAAPPATPPAAPPAAPPPSPPK